MAMTTVESYHQYAADCMQQARNEKSQADKAILLNVALAWMRLARQTEALANVASPLDAPAKPDADERELAPSEA
jgi:hypothetical protein